ncbi:NAD(P)-binding domain-containing protein [Pseudoflavitalea sp. G-6-1-2]|uniref:NAD(P)-dependent oxidoreductase n=1 Tax=Pseudoflavitalea sp. G-6-1-2 TaxID=2728841 RepID=UPI00146B4EE2|nr:NAD(P)-binding domain-containing protein [Pseudoflavitalea sp. G-6-1-2]NML22256.1 NAD(P)-binding domain-containing protein [Pseudoflavitalea sp. G-6-1-2]
MIAFIGMGLLGSNFTKALLKRGEKVQVWNRTFEKAKALEADGAKAFENIEDAVRGVKRIHITLSDDAIVDAVLAQAAPALEAGAVIIDHTTTSVEGAVNRTQSWAAKNITYVHVPVFMGPANALESSGVMLISGSPSIAANVLPMIEPMTGKVLNLGDKTGQAAGIKLLGNMFLLTLTGGFSDMLATAKSMGIASSGITDLFKEWNPGAMAPARLNRLLAADYDNPSWELQMARKDARLMIEEAARGNRTLTVIPAIADEMDKWLAKGFAHKDWSVIASDNL